MKYLATRVATLPNRRKDWHRRTRQLNDCRYADPTVSKVFFLQDLNNDIPIIKGLL